MTPSLVGFQQTSPGAFLLFHLTDNHGSCKGHIRNRLHTTPVIWCSGWYLLHKTVIFGSSMTPFTHRQTCISQSNPSSPPLQTCTMLPSLSSSKFTASLTQWFAFCPLESCLNIQNFSAVHHMHFSDGLTEYRQHWRKDCCLCVCVAACVCVYF